MRRLRRMRPTIEVLDRRELLATFGVPWPDAGRLTISFAPDGTPVAGRESGLGEVLGSRFGDESWKLEILRAFQTWASLGNIGLSLSADNGKPLGERGPIQGNREFGDIRIAGHAMGPEALAIAAPYDLADSWSGDVIIDTTDPIGRTAPGVYDLYSIALHEAGHSFGLPPSLDPTSAMYDLQTAGSVRLGPNSSDISGLRSLYGARREDRFEGSTGNGTTGAATALAFIENASELGTPASAPRVADGDLTTAGDVDVYRVVTRSDTDDFFVELRTSGISLLTARVTVTDSSGRIVGSAISTDPTNGDLSIFVQNAAPSSSYFVRVERSGTDVFGIGGYRLAVGREAHEEVFPAEHSGYLNDDQHTDDSLATARVLAATATAEARPDQVIRASITDPEDVDFTRFTAPTVVGPGAIGLTVSTWAMEVDKLDPLVTVYDASGHEVAARVTYNDKSAMTLFVPSVTPGATYYLAVRATDAESSYNEGDYFVGLNFRHGGAPVVEFAEGVLDAGMEQDFRDFEVRESLLFRFELGIDDHGAAAATAARLTLYDEADQVVFSAVATEWALARRDVVLEPGRYVARIAGGTLDGRALPLVSYTLRHDGRTDPTGPRPVNPVVSPVPRPPGTRPKPDPYIVWRLLRNVYERFLALRDGYERP